MVNRFNPHADPFRAVAWVALAFFFAVLIGGIVSTVHCDAPEPVPAAPDAGPLHDPKYVLASG